MRAGPTPARTRAEVPMRFVTLSLVAVTSIVHADPPRLRGEPRGPAPIVIDARLDEAPWRRAAVGEGFVERTPHPGEAAPVRTTVRVLFDEDALYVGVESFIAEGETPRGLELTRDSMDIWEDDAISVKVDARRDGRTTLGFVVNPAGAQLDYLAVENGQSLRRELDAVWQSAARVERDRWVVELRLPAAALGLSAQAGPREIGLNVTRDHNARSATYDWAPTPPEFGPFSALHYGVVEGLVIGGGAPIALTLYSLGEYRSLREDGARDAMRAAIGADAWARLAADTWLEGTLFTDFSQVDLDDALVNLDRFPLFFPERRPFFLNGLDVFAAGVPEHVQPFYSRRIGLGADASTLPVIGGLKLYGREGPLSFGILDVLTDGTLGAPATNDLAARARVALDGRASYLGGLVAARMPFHWDGAPVAGSGAHVTYAADWRLRAGPDQRIELAAFAAGTATDDGDSSDEGGSTSLFARYRGEIWQPLVSALWVQGTFLPELGFVRRRGATRLRVESPIIGRPSGAFRRVQLTLNGEAQTSEDFQRMLYLIGEADLEVELFDGWICGAGADYVEDTVVEDFEIVRGVYARAGTYQGANLDLWLSSPGQRNPAFELYYAVSNAYFGGVLHNPWARFRASLGPHLRFDVSADVYYVMLREYAPFWTWALNALARITPTTRLQIDVLGRINAESERATAMLRLRWRYQPGSDLFFVWREDVTWIAGQVTSERTVTLKTTLRFDGVL